VTWEAVTFYILAVVTVTGAAGVVFSSNIVRAAFFLVASFLGVAALYFLLGADFLGLVQIMIYAGAVSVLVIFAVMLVIKDDIRRTSLFHPVSRWWGAAIAVLLTTALGKAVWQTSFPAKGLAVETDRVGQMAKLLLGDYVVAFEVAAVLLLVAIVGAIILAKGGEE